MTWNEELHPRDREGQFAHASAGSWARKAAEDLATAYAARNVTPPPAKLKGLIRVGDHPEGYGKLGAVDPKRDPLPQSSHPEAGGVWIDPRETSVGRRRYYNDSGWMPVSGYRPKARSRKHKDRLQDERRGDYRGRPDETDLRWEARDARTLDPYAGATGGFGYGARSEMAHSGPAEAFVAHMKRVQPRTRQEAAREAVRRTPRGTRVSGWMDQAGARIARTRGQ